MAKHNDFGKRGEDAAVEFLQSKGYTIVERNWRFSRLEIDIIAFKSDEIIFIEVKTRNSRSMQARELVSQPKQKKIIKAAEEYILKHNINKDARFDIILVHSNGSTWDIEHIEYAFYPTL